ncbi:diadenosine tetraphosphate hydrolase [Microbacterium suwonense]|uniref:DeoR family transcriptional regulator n=1 Tax=Microbacterium suwonense TaxID=683047 RepID=A0ABN6X8Z4_9MICO|nr:diadenosine tetraphosphate hydrolase [Microbacterium suwonense]BDZ40487.1 DeoR family transcriptional regulator [Microbacterium suwonense]
MHWRDDRIGSAARGENPTLLAQTPAGYAVIGDVQFLPGYSVLLSRDTDARALADLPRTERVQYLSDVDLLATAVERACRKHDPAFRRMNIEILGNTDAFVHAHLWPRYDWEPAGLVQKPVWLYDAAHWSDPAHALGPRHDALRSSITAELTTLLATGA